MLEHFKLSDIVSNFKTKATSQKNKIQSEKFEHKNLLPYCVRVKIHFDVPLGAFGKANCFLHHSCGNGSCQFYNEINLIPGNHTICIIASLTQGS